MPPFFFLFLFIIISFSFSFSLSILSLHTNYVTTKEKRGIDNQSTNCAERGYMIVPVVFQLFTKLPAFVDFCMLLPQEHLAIM